MESVNADSEYFIQVNRGTPMTTHYIPDTTPSIPYTIIKSARRTLGLEVRDGKVTVRVPDRLPEREAERFVMKHTDWIIKKLSEDKHRQQQKSDPKPDRTDEAGI